ncbi:hypothetical protein G7046_g9777 [Stylonectria norvegica]|nr:hypothetical protein G7046_g9777 [Stylonectria norvegica]
MAVFAASFNTASVIRDAVVDLNVSDGPLNGTRLDGWDYKATEYGAHAAAHNRVRIAVPSVPDVHVPSSDLTSSAAAKPIISTFLQPCNTVVVPSLGAVQEQRRRSACVGRPVLSRGIGAFGPYRRSARIPSPTRQRRSQLHVEGGSQFATLKARWSVYVLTSVYN